jgi:hypothetical protein
MSLDPRPDGLIMGRTNGGRTYWIRCSFCGRLGRVFPTRTDAFDAWDEHKLGMQHRREATLALNAYLYSHTEKHVREALGL